MGDHEREPKQVRYSEPTARVDLFARLTIGAAITVHKELGPGFIESLYEEALCLELRARDIPFARQVAIEIGYRGAKIGESRLDLLVADCLVVELKAVEKLLPLHSVQVRSYLKASRKSLGLLINFNVPVLRDGIQRVVLSKPLGGLGVLAFNEEPDVAEMLD
jgi:GxxExxY protein